MGNDASIGVLGKLKDEPEDVLPADDCSFLKAGVGLPSPPIRLGIGPGLSVMWPRWNGKPLISLGGAPPPLSRLRLSRTSERDGRLLWLAIWSSIPR